MTDANGTGIPSGRGVGGGGPGGPGGATEAGGNPRLMNNSKARSVSGVHASTTATTNVGPANNSENNRFQPSHVDAPPQNCVLVSRTQNGNAVLRHIRNVRWVFVDRMVPDFIMGPNTCAIFISLRYHLLHPNYLSLRVHELQRSFRLRVVLCLVDAEDVVKPMNEVNKIAAMGDCTLACAWQGWGRGRGVGVEVCSEVFHITSPNHPPEKKKKTLQHL